MAISMSRSLPMYLGVTSKPLSSVPPSRYSLHGPRRELPARRALPRVDLGERSELGGELLFRVQPQFVVAGRRRGI